jgi:hypothetical protein
VAKYAAKTITFSRNTTGSTYVNISQILELGPPGFSRDTIDATAYGDTWNDYLTGLNDGEEFSLKVAFDPSDAQHLALKGDVDAGLVKKFHLVNTAITPTRTLEISAIPVSWNEGGEMDGVYAMETTWKIVQPGVVIV